jgi:hypothetical protein
MRIALSLIPGDSELRLLDYGCGDGAFLVELSNRRGDTGALIGFEPFMSSLPNMPARIRILNEWASVLETFRHQPPNTVTCFEVMEHLTPALQAQALEQISGILHPKGTLVLSIPIECGPPAIPKNLLRYMKYGRNQKTIYNMSNIMKSFLGAPIPACRSGPSYLSHMGFYYWDLERVMAKYFKIMRKTHSPFGALGARFNSQIFYVAQPLSSRLIN